MVQLALLEWWWLVQALRCTQVGLPLEEVGPGLGLVASLIAFLVVLLPILPLELELLFCIVVHPLTFPRVVPFLCLLLVGSIV